MESRIEEILTRMTLREKVGEMHGILGIHALFPFVYWMWPYRTRGNKRLGIPPFIFTDGPQGIVVGHSTCFPAAIARGATFNPELERRVGAAIGLEARSQGANACGAVCVNILRHPGWGRAQETYGADTCHLGAMGAALTAGLAENVMPVVKHFACNSIELSRFRVNVSIDERTLREIYLPHFRECIDAGAPIVMTAYNKVNGAYCGENARLVRDILKGEWGFDGFTISDWVFGCRSTAPSIRAGLDIEMPLGVYYRLSKIRRALRNGEITMPMIDDAVLRILRVKERFGLFDRERPRDAGVVACDAHTNLALQVAREGIVLLRNRGELLPLRRDALRRIAVLGKLAAKPNLGSPGSVQVRPPWSVTPLAGIRRSAGSGVKVDYAPGGGRRGRERALRLAREADAVIIVAGLDRGDEGEYMPLMGGGDRRALELPHGQDRFIREIAAVNRNCVVVLVGGSAICVRSWIDEVPAALMAWYPGMQGGTALAEILFGDQSPSGRLPLTVPRETGQLPRLDTEAVEVAYDSWHDYRFFDHRGIDPEFPFGFGLGYTTFSYRAMRLDRGRATPGTTVTVFVTLANTGARAGEETVQIYVGSTGAAAEPRAPRELKAFRKVRLEAGEEREIAIDLRVDDCAYYDVQAGRWEVEKTIYRIYAGSSSRDLPLTAELRVSEK